MCALYSSAQYAELRLIGGGAGDALALFHYLFFSCPDFFAA